MEATIIDPLAFSWTSLPLFDRLRIRAAHREEIGKLVAEAEAVARPKALYKLAFIEAKGDDTITADGITFNSRVLRVNLDRLHRFFAFVGTSGHELEAWADSKQDMLAHFYADAINEAVLHAAMITFVAQLTEQYQLATTAVMNPGSLTDWPLREQRPLFALLGDVRVGHRRRADRQPADGPDASRCPASCSSPRKPSPVANCARATIVPTAGRRMTRGCLSGSTRTLEAGN